eukprot:1449879-Rhodomonas_salina.3
MQSSTKVPLPPTHARSERCFMMQAFVVFRFSAQLAAMASRSSSQVTGGEPTCDQSCTYFNSSHHDHHHDHLQQQQPMAYSFQELPEHVLDRRSDTMKILRGAKRDVLDHLIAPSVVLVHHILFIIAE